MRRVAITSMFTVFCAALAAPVPKDPERKLGPEWIKEKDSQDYTRKLELISVSSGGTLGYLYTHLPLVDYKRDLYVTEGLNFRGRTLGVRLSGEEDPPKREKDDTWKYGHPNKIALEVERTEGKDGQAVKHDVRLSKVRYYDFDGDGRFDAMEDRRDEKKILSHILISHADGEMDMVRIWTLDRKLNILPIRLSAYHNKIQYVFEKGNWREWTFEDKRQAEQGGKKDKDE